jgi:protein-tyrosine phosphatase
MVVEAERVLPLSGVHNFRDYGDYAVRGGGRLRRGWLYRSGQHRDATPEDLAAICALNLAAVIDLRGDSERRVAPCARPDGFVAKLVFVADETSGLAPHIEAARDVNDPAQAKAAMCAGYREMPFRPRLIQVMRLYFETLAETDGPSLIHCMAGKDRTGLAVALLHTAMGVHHDDIIADYVLTNVAGRAEERIAAGARVVRRAYGPDMSDEAVRVLMMVQPEYLEAAFASVRERYGDLDAYLVEVLGVTPERRRQIAARLVV